MSLLFATTYIVKDIQEKNIYYFKRNKIKHLLFVLVVTVNRLEEQQRDVENMPKPRSVTKVRAKRHTWI